MTSPPTSAVAKAAGATALLAGVFVGVPIALVKLVGNPWPGRTAFQLRDTAAILEGALATIGWIVLIVLASHTIGEFGRQIAEHRRHQAEHVAHRRSVAARSVGQGDLPAPRRQSVAVNRGLVPRLVAVILAVMLISRSPTPALSATGSPSLARPPVPTVVTPAPAAIDRPSGSTRDSTATLAASSVERASSTRGVVATRPTWRVQPRDTLWSIAARALGDAEAWREIWDLNQNHLQADGSRLTDPSLIRVGWQLLLPARAVTTSAGSIVQAPEEAIDRYVVEPGDGPWDVAEALVGDGSQWREVMAASIGTEVAPGVIYRADTKVIHPGWVFMHPDHATSIERPVVEHDAPPRIDAPVVILANPTPAPLPVAVPPTERVSPLPPPPPLATPAPTPTSPPVVQTPTAPAPAPADEVSDGWRDGIATRIGWYGPAALAAGLLGVIGAVRHRPRVGRRRRPTAESTDLEVAVRTTPKLDTVDWAAATLRGLAGELRPDPGEPWPTPRLVKFGNDGLEVLWTEPRPTLVDGWTSPDGGWTWNRERHLDPVASTITAPFPALVTIGRTDDADVLLNLEAVTAVTLTGDASAVQAMARSICLETSTTPFNDVAMTLMCAFDIPGAEHFDWLTRTTITEATGWLRDTTNSAAAVMAHCRVDSLAAVRALGRSADAHESGIVLIDADQASDAELAGMRSMSKIGGGVVVIVDGAGQTVAFDQGCVLRCSADSIVVEPYGVELEPIGISTAHADGIGLLLDEAAGVVTPSELDELLGTPDLAALADYVDFDPQSVLSAEYGSPLVVASTDDDGIDPRPSFVLSVLGPVSISGGRPGTKWATPEMELAIFLAFHRRGATQDTIRDAVWPDGSADQTWRNTMTKLRSKLGLDSTAAPHLSNRGDHGRYHLGSEVVTDWDLFLGHARRAANLSSSEAIDEYRQALEVVGGAPFSDVSKGYSWAFSDGTVTEIVETIKQVALAAGRLFLDHDDPASAAWAATRGELAASTLLDCEDLVELHLGALRACGNPTAVDELELRLRAEFGALHRSPTR